uniref:Cellulase n=1 Tax=uncultured symbiotic protist of Mastotermes darwiniensis TaxID=403661 RepID=A4UX35_9EUKA|nr:putative glycosyl hydrolase family45 [uncultured symbiotic protist of Mastotermes darwiniensis]
MFLALVFGGLAGTVGLSGSGKTTRYWDCCKPSCSWTKKAAVDHVVNSCTASGQHDTTTDLKSGCDGGPSYACFDQAPWAVDSSYFMGTAAATVASESTICCGCFELTFTSGQPQGKKMLVQVTNTGSDVGNGQFDLLIPGGGVGIFDGCSKQFPGSYQWGQRYGGVTTAAACSGLPTQLQAGCKFRFDYIGDNPAITYKGVKCPTEITTKTGCRRNDDA